MLGLQPRRLSRYQALWDSIQSQADSATQPCESSSDSHRSFANGLPHLPEPLKTRVAIANRFYRITCQLILFCHQHGVLYFGLAKILGGVSCGTLIPLLSSRPLWIPWRPLFIIVGTAVLAGSSQNFDMTFPRFMICYCIARTTIPTNLGGNCRVANGPLPRRQLTRGNCVGPWPFS